MSIIIERYYQLLSLLLISEMLECEKICVLELMKESMSCFFAFGNKDLLKGSRQGHLAFSLGFWPLFHVRFMQGGRVVRHLSN